VEGKILTSVLVSGRTSVLGRELFSCLLEKGDTAASLFTETETPFYAAAVLEDKP
jgi:hypothetical protein